MPVRPLPRSLEPLADESLSGFLLRLAHRLDLAPSRIAVLTGLGKAIPGRSDMIVPAGHLLHLDTATAAAFAQATRLSTHEVASLCLDSLHDRYPPLDLSHQADGVPRQAGGITGLTRWVFTRSTRYCPQCLAGDGTRIQRTHGGAWQKRWRLPVVFACTVHRRLLLQECPRCRRSVHSRRGGGLLPRSHDATLHPAQCRTPVGAGAHWHQQSACGARLDLLPAARSTVPGSGHREDPAEDLALERLLGLQHKLVGLLEPGGPTEFSSAGWRAIPAQYFLDLRLLVGLLQASWPQARPLAEPWMQVDTIDRHLDQQRRRAADAQQTGRKRSDLVVHDRPPAEPAACAGLLALADQILTLESPLAAQQVLDPLISHAAMRNSWVQHLLRAQVHCSDGLREAIEPQLRRLRPTSGYLRPTRAYRFGAQHIPQYLPVDWYDRHFHGLTGLNPRLLRRLAAIKLVQLTQGGSQPAAARRLGLPPGRHTAATGTRVHRWTRDEANSTRLHAALHALAAELDATPAIDLIDYDRRRDALRAWSFPADDWHELATDLRRRQGASARASTGWGERKRQVASVLVWARVTQGDHLFAPLARQAGQASGRNELAYLVQQAIRWSRSGRPEHHYVALRAALNDYADRLAARIDSGWAPLPAAQKSRTRQVQLRSPAT
jgi:TniQ